MNSRILTLILIILTLASASLAAYRPIFPEVHGAGTSLVCLADPGFTVTSSNACPATAPTFTGPTVTSSEAQLRVNIDVNNTSALNGFDITILADHTKLQPFGVDLSSGMLPSLLVSNECIGGIAVQGTCPSQAANTPDSIELGAGGSTFTTNPAFGILFTAIYTIVGNTTGATFSFQTGCGGLTSLPPLCVILTSGGTANDPVNAVTVANYVTSSSAQPIVVLRPRPLVLNLTQGAAGRATSNMTMIELDGFSCGGVNCVTLSIIKPLATGLSISTNTTQLSDPPSNGVRISVSTTSFTPSGIFTFFVQAAPLIGPSAPSTGSTYLGSLTNVTVTVVGANDFAISAVPNKVLAKVGSSGVSTVEIAWGKSLTGTIGFRPGFPTALTCVISPQYLSPSTLTPLQSATLSCVSSAAGTYVVSINAYQLSLVHTVLLSYIAVGPPPGPPSTVGILPGNVSSTGPNLAPGNQVTFAVNLTNAPPIHAYTIQLEYNPKVLGVASNGIDPSGGLLGNTIQTLVECVDGTPVIGNTCTSLDGAGVTTLFETIVGSGNSTGSSGILFTVKFNILARGVSQIHLLNAVVVEGATDVLNPPLLDVQFADGYFSNMLCGGQLCQPPAATFTISPPLPIAVSSPTQFDASASNSPNQGATIFGYTWFWDDAGSINPEFEFTKSPVIQHTFGVENLHLHFITLAVNDTYGTIGYATVKAQVVPSALDFALVGCPLVVVPSGSQATCTLTVFSHASSTITVALSVSGPSYVPTSISPSSLILAAMSNNIAILTVSNPPGNAPATITLTVTGMSGSIAHSVSILVNLMPALPPDFLLNIYPTNLTIPAGSSAVSDLFATGLRGFGGTITLTGNISPSPSNAPSASFNPPTLLIDPSQPSTDHSLVTLSTVPTTPPEKYILTVLGTSGPLAHLAQVFIQVTPPPLISVSPSSGTVGTKVLVNGSGFQPSQIFQYPVEVTVTFDDMFVGFLFTQNGRFNFTFDVPQAQPGTHQIKASTNLFASTILPLTAQASFLVQASPTTPTISMDSGTVYFPGDTAVIYILTTVNGSPVAPSNSQLELTLIIPNGTKIVLHPSHVSAGVYKSSYTIPSTGSLGIYALVARLHVSGSIDAFALRSFEVKLSWLSSNGKTIGAAVTIAGSLGMLGLGWKRGLFKRKDEEPSQF